MLNQLSLNQRSFLPSLSTEATDLSPVLAPESWPFDLDWLPAAACLVGGSVRDALLGRRGEYLDLDFVLPQGAVETAQAIARFYKAGFVLLDAERQIARVVFPQGTADFAQQVGPTLEADLQRRDFTVNAIAYNPHTDQLLDPLRGYADLQKRVIRMVSPVNLAEDPLRLLRAYRQAAQLGFTLEPETRAVVQTLAPRLRQIAAERVQSELNYLLRTHKGTPWLAAAWQDGVLRDWFPTATAAGVELLAECDRAMAQIQETLPELAQELGQSIRSAEHRGEKKSASPRTWLSLAKLTCLLAVEPAQAEVQLRRLKYSRHEIQAVGTILKGLPWLRRTLASDLPDGAGRQDLSKNDDLATDDLATDDLAKKGLLESEGAMVPRWAVPSRRSQFLFFQQVGGTFAAIALRALAEGTPKEALAPLIQRFLTAADPVAHPVPLLTGQDLMRGLGISPGPKVGQLLAAIQMAHAESQVATIDEALAFAQHLLHGVAE